MKTYIDLLPQQKKDEIRRGKIVRMIIAREISLLFPVLLLIVILISINLILQVQNSAIGDIYKNDQALSGNQEIRRFEEKFKEINAKLEVVSQIQDKHLGWSGVLVKLSQLTPDGVYVTGLANKEYQIFLVGKVKTREILLDFQQALNGSDCFIETNVPLSNLVSKNDIEFQLDFRVKEECLSAK